MLVMIDKAVVEREQRRGPVEAGPDSTARSNVGAVDDVEARLQPVELRGEPRHRQRLDAGKRRALDVAHVVIEHRSCSRASCDALRLDQPQRRVARWTRGQVFVNHPGLEVAIQRPHGVGAEVLALIQPAAARIAARRARRPRRVPRRRAAARARRRRSSCCPGRAARRRARSTGRACDMIGPVSMPASR